MKKLLAILLAVAMLLSLGIVAYANNGGGGEQGGETPKGSITVMDAPESVTYTAYKIFDVVKGNDDKLTYSISNDSAWFGTIVDTSKDGPNKSKIDGLEIILKAEGGSEYIVKQLAGFDPAAFAETLTAAVSGKQGKGSALVNGAPTMNELVPGYYLVVPSGETKDPSVLTTVLDKDVKVQNKQDMPLDKEVKSPDNKGNNEGVNIGDQLDYTVTAKVPAYTAGEYEYTYILNDKMSDGLTFGNEITITVGDYTNKITYTPPTGETSDKLGKITQTATATSPLYFDTTVNPVRDPSAPLTGNQIRFDENGYTFELSLDVWGKAFQDANLAGETITITYTGTVNENALGEILNNTAQLIYGDSAQPTIKDAETNNYVSQIIIDKFETGNRYQKLAGATFVLYTGNENEPDPTPIKYYQLKGVLPTEESGAVKQDFEHKLVYNAEGTATKIDPVKVVELMEFDGIGIAVLDDNGNPKTYTWTTGAGEDAVTHTEYVCYGNLKVEWVEGEANASKVVTDGEGYACFPYLKDNDAGESYYIKETVAPVDYTKLLNPIERHVNGKPSTDTRLSYQQRIDALTDVVPIANTPGSNLPSTGGVGATLLTVGGVALILAAGAFLVLRRKEQE